MVDYVDNGCFMIVVFVVVIVVIEVEIMVGLLMLVGFIVVGDLCCFIINLFVVWWIEDLLVLLFSEFVEWL